MTYRKIWEEFFKKRRNAPQEGRRASFEISRSASFPMVGLGLGVRGTKNLLSRRSSNKQKPESTFKAGKCRNGKPNLQNT